MAFCAARDICRRKLLPVDVLVAVLARGGRCFEVHVDQFGFQIRRFVAVFAGCGSMRAEQSKWGLRVIEARELLPRLGAVTRFASGHRAIRTHLQHALLELAFMRICMTTSAVQILPMVDHGLRL